MATNEWGEESDGEAGDDFGFDTEGFDREDVERSGDLVDKEGYYHFEVADVKPDLAPGDDKTPNICFNLLVLQTVDGQSPAGSMLFHRIYLGKAGAPPAEGSQKSALKFGVALELLEWVERDGRQVAINKATGQTRIPASMWNAAKGRQVVAKVKLEKSGNPKFKDKYAIPFGEAYAVDDPRCASVPKNTECLALIGKKVVEAPAAKPATKPAAPAAAAAKAPFDDEDLSDL